MTRSVAPFACAVLLAAAGIVHTTARAQGIGNTCDAAVTKAAGQKVACRTGVIAQGQKKGVAPDATKLARCDSKFNAACMKANNKAKTPCSPGHADCSAAGLTETAADACSAQLASPSGAFIGARG
jgi:hypothetical protein